MSTPADYLNSLFGLQGKTALVTGGTRGIGASIAVALAKAGANIILLARDPSAPQVSTVTLQITSLNRTCLIVRCDLLTDSRDSIRSTISSILSQQSVDILINCAGLNKRNEAIHFTDSDWDDVIRINLTSCFTLCQIVGEYWISKRQDGSGEGGGDSMHNKKIINVSSILSRLGSRNVVSYVASKGGLQQMTRGLSNEWMKEGINVNALAPGYFATEFTQKLQDDPERNAQVIQRCPAGRWGQPSDIDGAVVYLASQASNFVSGETLTVDGGYSWYC